MGTKAFGRPKPVEAVFSTEVSLSPQAILETYADRWAIEIAIRDGHAYYGVAQDQCRKLAHIVGANTFRLLMPAARTLWCIVTSEQRGNVVLQRCRPWYRQKVAPSQCDVAWAWRAVLPETGIFPYLAFSLLWPKISQRVMHQSRLLLETTKLMPSVASVLTSAAQRTEDRASPEEKAA